MPDLVHRHAEDAHLVLQREEHVDEVPQIGGGVLDRDHVRQLRDRAQQLERHVDVGARRPVVDADRQRHRRVDLAIETEDLAVGRHHVRRRRHQDAVEAMLGRKPRMRGYFRDGVRAAARDQRHLAAQLARDGCISCLRSAGRDREPLALRAADDDAVHPLIPQPLQQPLHGLEVERPVARKRRRDAGIYPRHCTECLSIV